MIKKSKIIYVLAIWFAYVGLTGVYSNTTEFGTKGALWDTQALLATVVGLICAVGFYLHRRWALWTYLGALPLCIAMNFIWLRDNPPPQLFWGTMFLITLVINLLPATLMWIRRGRLTASVTGAVNA